jgi:hypothetical protein
MHEPTDQEVESAIGKKLVKIDNGKVAQNALEELTRVEVSELSHDEAIAYADAVESLTYLRESVSDPEERRPNAKVDFGVTDDG